MSCRKNLEVEIISSNCVIHTTLGMFSTHQHSGYSLRWNGDKHNKHSLDEKLSVSPLDESLSRIMSEH